MVMELENGAAILRSPAGEFFVRDRAWTETEGQNPRGMGWRDGNESAFRPVAAWLARWQQTISTRLLIDGVARCHFGGCR
jgi:hypothetical protein